MRIPTVEQVVADAIRRGGRVGLIRFTGLSKTEAEQLHYEWNVPNVCHVDYCRSANGGDWLATVSFASGHKT